MVPKRIMDSSAGSLSKLIIEFEPLDTITSVKTQDAKLMQKNNAINMIQNYGTISNTPPIKQDTQHQHQGESTITNVLWNMLNQIIGTGILGIPYIYKSTGIIGSIIIMLIFGIVSVYTLNLIIYCGKKLNVYNYEELLEKCFGIKGYIISSFCIAILNIGGMLTNLIIIGDATIKVLSIWEFDSLLDRHIVLLTISFLVILPFCLFRDLSSLEKAGAVKIIAIIVIIIVIFLEFFNSLSSSNNNNTNKDITLNIDIYCIPAAVGTLAFSFVCHDSSFLLYNTLSNPTNKRYFKLSFLGIFIAIIFTLCLSIPAYLTFGNNVDFNILNNYNIYNPLIIAIRIIYVFTMTLTFPCSFFLVRHIFYGWFQKLYCVYSTNHSNNFMAYTVQSSPIFHHLSFTLTIFIIIVIMSLFVDDLGVVMSVIGSVSSVNLAFVFPCLCYMTITLKSNTLCVYKTMFNLIIPFVITLTGITVAIYGVASQI
eukprot:321688_1